LSQPSLQFAAAIVAGGDRLQARPWLRAVNAKLPFALGFAVLWGLTIVPAAVAEGRRGAALLGVVFFHPLVTMAILTVLLTCVDVRWPRHRLKFVFLIAVATIASVAGGTADMLFLIGSGIWTQPYTYPLSVVWWGNFGSALATCLIAAYALDSRTRIKQRGEVLAAVRRERAVVRRRTVEARLQATQARIDPQFLFDVLASVERVREMSVADGDRLLDDLIAYLRAALPDVVAGSTNLGRELALAVAWLDIQCVLRRERLQCKVYIPEALHPVPFPPMTLVPMLEAALASVSMSESV